MIKGTIPTILKLLIAVVIGYAVNVFFGPAGFPGITPVVITAARSNAPGAVYAALAGRFGDATDVGAVSILCISNGPFLTMVALGATGLADIPFMTLMATAVPPCRKASGFRNNQEMTIL